MWQRRQTIFMLCSLAAVVVCLFMPVGSAEGQTLGSEALLTNLAWTDSSIGGRPAWILFLWIAIAGIISAVTIFLYKNRKLQIKLCTWGIFFDVMWYIHYAVIYFGRPAGMEMHIKFAAFLPLVSCVFLWLAQKGVKADEKLVRSMDRIR